MSEPTKTSPAVAVSSKSSVKSVTFVVSLTLPISQGSMLGKSKTSNLTDEQKLARFYLNAVLKRGGILVSETVAS